MGNMNRRDFMKCSAGVMAGSLGLAALRAAAAEGTPAATAMRTLGKTGIQCTLLGMGTVVRGWNGSSALTDQRSPSGRS